jgi:hypothetical protein
MLRLIILAAACLTIVPVFFATFCSASERGISISWKSVRKRCWNCRSDSIWRWNHRTSASGNSGFRPQPILGRTRRGPAWPAAAVEGSYALEDWLDSITAEDRRVAKIHLRNEEIRFDLYHAIPCRACGRQHPAPAVGGLGLQRCGGTSKTIGIVWDVTADAEAAETLRKAKDLSDIKNAELELALDELSHREAELVELSGKLDLALDSYQCGIWEATLSDEGGSYWDERMHELYGLHRRLASWTRKHGCRASYGRPSRKR